jgi:tRNA (guanine37-N1)-methyltransferase
MRIDIVTLHPTMFAPLESSIIGRAREKGLVDINIVNLRDFGLGRYRQVDDTPYGGGAGMVLRADVIKAAVDSVNTERSIVVLMDPVGTPFKQDRAQALTEQEHLIFICGHYEGVDARIRDTLVDEMISIGDFVLTGGELPTMVVVDAVVRLLPEVLGNRDSLSEESFNNGFLEAPVYTRPAEFMGVSVPKILLSGHHKKIEEFRAEESLRMTQEHRPDLLKKS